MGGGHVDRSGWLPKSVATAIVLAAVAVGWVVASWIVGLAR